MFAIFDIYIKLRTQPNIIYIFLSIRNWSELKWISRRNPNDVTIV